MRHAVHQELIEHNPAANQDGIITPPVKRHYPALPLERLPELLANIEDYKQGRELTRLAVSLTLHLFIRSSELHAAYSPPLPSVHHYSETDTGNLPASGTYIPR